MRDDSLKDLRTSIQQILGESKPCEKRLEKDTAINKEDDERLRKELEIDALQTENDIRKEELKNCEQDRQQRKEFATKIYHFLCVYLFFVFLLILLSGASCIKFELTEGVIITLLSTTTANVIGIFILVVKYLFASKR